MNNQSINVSQQSEGLLLSRFVFFLKYLISDEDLGQKWPDLHRKLRRFQNNLNKTPAKLMEEMECSLRTENPSVKIHCYSPAAHTGHIVFTFPLSSQNNELLSLLRYLNNTYSNSSASKFLIKMGPWKNPVFDCTFAFTTPWFHYEPIIPTY
ncbi:hypothetical protein P9112_000367 [Eukaryota sp. TZLM1-RC]